MKLFPQTCCLKDIFLLKSLPQTCCLKGVQYCSAGFILITLKTFFSSPSALNCQLESSPYVKIGADKVRMYEEEIMMNDGNPESSLPTSSLLKMCSSCTVCLLPGGRR